MGCGTSVRRTESSQAKFKQMKLSEYNKEVTHSAKYVLFEDVILDAANLSALEKGGPLDFSNCIGIIYLHKIPELGSEISRFIYGCSAMPGLKQSPMLDREIIKLKDFTIGKIVNPFSESLFIKNDAGGGTNWYLQARTNLTTSQFILSFYRHDIMYPVMPPRFDMYGKYVTLYSSHLKQTRIYSLSFTLSPYLYHCLIEMVNSLQKRKPFVSPFQNINLSFKPYLDLFVKKQTGVSKYLCEMPLIEQKNKECSSPASGHSFTLKGPYVFFLIYKLLRETVMD